METDYGRREYTGGDAKELRGGQRDSAYKVSLDNQNVSGDIVGRTVVEGYRSK
jgi:hypothetical protein